MYKINWSRFELKNPDKENAFEKMCRHLFLRKTKKSGYDFSSNYNQSGLETEPVQFKEKYYGFQCKYVTGGSSTSLYDQLWKSLHKAFTLYEGKLDVVYIYTNANIKPNISTQDLNDLKKKSKRILLQREANKKRIRLEWITKDSFDEILNEIGNSDIYRLFFSEQNEVNFINSSITIEERTFLESDDYISLNVNNASFEYFEGEFRKNKCSILTGDAGSGKSEMLKKLFVNHAKSFLEGKNDENAGIKDIPVFLKLRECINGNLESLIRERLRDYSISLGTDQELCYYLDGLDELGLDDINDVINTVLRVLNTATTKAVIITSRVLSPNLLFINREVNAAQFKIDRLDKTAVMKYVMAKSDEHKLGKFNQIIEENNGLLDEFDDILSLKLFWNEIDRIDAKMTKVDIIKLSVEGIISKNKRIDQLNIPETKRENINEILMDISIMMQKEGSLNISLLKLQEIVSARFSRLTYKEVDFLIVVMAELLFDEVPKESIMRQYSFKHRRYQEYFLYKRISQLFYNNPFVLRTFGLFSNKDFILNIFLLQELRDSFQSKDILKYTTLKFLETYLGDDYINGYENDYIGNEKHFGIVGTTLLETDIFLDVLCSKSIADLSIWLSDKNFEISAFLTQKNYWTFIKKYYEMNNTDIREFLNDFYDLDSEFTERAIKLDFLAFIYCRCVIDGNSYSKFYYDCTNNLEIVNIGTDLDYYPVNDGREVSIYYSFYSMGVKSFVAELSEILDDMNPQQIEILCFMLLQSEYINVLHENNEYAVFKDHLVKKIKSCSKAELAINTIAIYHLIIGEVLNEDLISERYNKHNTNYYNTWSRNIDLNSYSAIILNKEDFYHMEYSLGVEIRKIILESYNLHKEDVLDQITNSISKYNLIYNNRFNYNNSKLIGHILAILNFPENSIRIFLNSISKFSSVVSMTVILYTVRLMNKGLFKLIANLKMLNTTQKMESENISYYDTNTELNLMFVTMTAEFDSRESDALFVGAINNSIFRPAFRKDDLVSGILPSCINKICENGLMGVDKCEDYIERTYTMLEVVAKTTDGGGDFEHIKAVINKFYPDFGKLDKIYDVTDINISESEDYSEIDYDQIDYDNLSSYYDCLEEDVNYNNLETWKRLIAIEEKKDPDLGKLFKMLNDNYFPNPFASNASKNFCVITAALMNSSKHKEKIIDYLIDTSCRYSIVNMFYVYSILSDNRNVQLYIERILSLSEVLVYPNEEDREEYIYDIYEKARLGNIILKSKDSDWIKNYDTEELVYKPNTDLKIKKDILERETLITFDWATCYPNTEAYKIDYSVSFRNIATNWFSLVCVDGGRAVLPFPKQNTKIVLRLNYKLAQLLGNKSSLNNYLQLSGLRVE